MWGNYNHSISIKVNSSVENTVFNIEKMPFDKQEKCEKKLNFENDTDFQAFLLPLEQDFTKSSKGYASLISSIPSKEIIGAHRKSEQKGSEINNMLFSENFSDANYLKITSDKVLHDSPCSSNHEFTNCDVNLCRKKDTQLTPDTLKNTEDDHNSKSVFSKNCMEITHNALNSYEVNVSETDGNLVFFKECREASCNYSTILNSGDFSDKSTSDNSELLNSSYNGCSSTASFDDDSCSDDSIIFSEKITKKKKSSIIENRRTFIVNSDSSESSDDDCLNKKNNCTFFSENYAFECGSGNLMMNPMVLQSSVNDSVAIFSVNGYINACFEDEDILFEESTFLKSINESWNDSMKNISGEPHEPKRVSFVPLPDLVSIYSYEAEDDNYCYSLHVLDQLRFQSRIRDFESIIAPYLTPDHRANIFQRNCF